MDLSLESWRANIGYHPYYFWQQKNSLLETNSECNPLVSEYQWQNQMAQGREEIRRAIKDAHGMMRDYLGFSVGKNFREKTVRYPLTKTDQWKTLTARGQLKSLHVGEGMIHRLGGRVYTTLAESATVTYSSSYGVVTDTFEVSIPIPTGLDYDYFEVHYTESDQLYNFSEDRKVIRPVEFSVNESGDTLTVTGSSWIMVRPERYQNPMFTPIDPDNTTDIDVFVQSVDIFSVKAYSQGQEVDNAPIVLQYTLRDCTESEMLSTLDVGLQGVYTQNAITQGIGESAILKVPASAQIMDGRMGYLGVPAYVQPDRVTFRYWAGADYNSDDSPFRDAGDWELTMTRLATAVLASRVCTCEQANQTIYEWQFDRAITNGEGGLRYSISEEDLNNPFGTKQGQIYAYNKVKLHQLTRGMSF